MTLLGRQLVAEGQPDQAVAILRRALATDPLSRTAQEFLAEALADRGEFAGIAPRLRDADRALSGLHQREEQLRLAC